MYLRIAFFAILFATGFAHAAETCDRARLEGFVNQYLAALVASDPSKLPLSQNARYTENGQELKLGDGHVGPDRDARKLQAVFRRSTSRRGGLLRHDRRARVVALRKTSGVFSHPEDLMDKRSFIKR